MIGVAMGDYDSIDLIGWDVLQQLRHGRISHVEYESKVILLNQKAAACLTCGGPRSARPQNSHPHRLTLGEARLRVLRRDQDFLARLRETRGGSSGCLG
jgi:hypothetical protein